MPSRSHGRCKVCRAVIHIQHRFGMCKRCSDRHNARIAEQRKQTRLRQQRRAAAIQAALPAAVLEEDTMPEIELPLPDKPARRGRYPRPLSGEQEVELLDAYTTTGEPLKDLSQRFGVHPTYVYNVLSRAGVDWRRGNAESFEAWQANQARPQPTEETVPPETEKALENMLRLPVLPPRPEPVAPTPTVERRVPQPAPGWGPRWVIRVEGELTSDLSDISEVVAAVKKSYPNLRIIAINPA